MAGKGVYGSDQMEVRRSGMVPAKSRIRTDEQFPGESVADVELDHRNVADREDASGVAGDTNADDDHHGCRCHKGPAAASIDPPVRRQAEREGAPSKPDREGHFFESFLM
jgi:hypothetical protein